MNLPWELVTYILKIRRYTIWRKHLDLRHSQLRRLGMRQELFFEFTLQTVFHIRTDYNEFIYYYAGPILFKTQRVLTIPKRNGTRFVYPE